MPPLVHPISVSHQGMSVLFVSQFDETKQQTTISYNVLDPSRGNPDNNLDWLGYRTLTFPAQVATAAMSVARQTRTVNSSGLLQVVSDQQYIYVFRAQRNSIYVNRYGLVQVPPSNPQSDPNWELRPTWEVRYRRSSKADLPANPTDTPSAFDMNGSPFVDPVYELPLGVNGINLEQASFWASLQPTEEEGTFRWQLFVPNLETGRIAAYSFARTPDGWFAIDPEQIDEETSAVLPDAEIELSHSGAVLKVSGPLTATNYSRQEPVFTDSSGVISMKRATRVLLAVPVLDSTQATRLVTVDFGVSLEGTLAGLEPPADDRVVSWEAGKVQPAGSMLEFDGASAIQIMPSPSAGPLYLPQAFTMEAWVNPYSTTLDPQFIIGGRVTDPVEQQAPSMFIIDKLRVGVSFGDGTKLISNVTKSNVLSLNAWNHIAVENNAAGARIFINGVQMELESALVPSVTPYQTAVTSIGARAQWQTVQVRGEQITAAVDTEHEYVGLLDEVRIWNKALTAEEITTYLYREIPADEAAKMTDLAGYWRLDDGSGKTAYDLSQYMREGHLSGPRWESTTSPVLPEQGAKIYFDEHSLTSVVGVLLPEPDHPNFVDLAPGSRVALLDSADGLVHLYFQGNGSNLFFGAQFDTTIDRAYYSFPWIAGASEPKDKQTGVFVPVARQSGSVLNHATFKLTPSVNAHLCDLSLDDGRGTTEQWKGLPRRVATLIGALNGDSISQPMDHRLNDLTKSFYDYGGTIPIGIVQGDNPDMAHLLWFLSARSKAFALKRVAFGTPADGKADLTIEITSDLGHQGETLSRILRGVPSDPASFSLTLRGGNPNFDYSSQANPEGTIVYAIPALPTPLSAFIVGTAITAARFTVSAASGGDPTLCDFTALLNPESDSGPQATWRNVPRDGSNFVAAVQAGTDPDQKKVLELIRIMNPGHTTLANGAGVEPGNVIAFLSTFNAVNDGITEELPAFDCQTAVLQGASTNVATVDLANGSQIVAATNPVEPSNGYPALIDLGTSGSVTASMLKPGKDGGWLNEPPRSAVRIHTDGLLKGNAETQDAKALAPANDLTVEAWAMILESPPGLELYYPRILQNVVSKADSVDRYMLGLAMTSTLQFLRNTTVSTNDNLVPDASAQLRLFPEEDFTVQFYIRPDLSTPSGQNKLFEKAAAQFFDVGYVRLTTEKDGTLALTIKGMTGNAVTSTPFPGDPVKLRDKIWQCVTVSRSGARATVYVDAIPSQYIDNPPSTKSPRSGLLIGGNDVAAPLQMRLNAFGVWKRALSEAEIAARLWKVLPRDDLGLQLLWGMDDGLGNDMTVANAATATFGYYDTTAQGATTFWNYPGVFYRAYFACRDLAMQSRFAVAASEDWHHYSGSYESKYGLELDESNYADCGTDGSLNVRDGLSLEAWIWPDAPSSANRRAIVSKYGYTDSNRSYELGLNTQNQPYLTVRLDGQRTQSGAEAPERLRLRTFTAGSKLPAGAARYIVGAAGIVTMRDANTDRDVYSLAGQVYVDGVPQIPGPEQAVPPAMSSQQLYQLEVIGGSGSGYYKAGDEVAIRANDTTIFEAWRGLTKTKGSDGKDIAIVDNTLMPVTTVKMPAQSVTITATGVFDHLTITQSAISVNIGRSQSGTGDTGTAYYSGGISDVRIWSKPLGAKSVATAYAFKASPPSTEGLISSYLFHEQQGNVARDSNANNNATLSSSELWTVFHDAALLQLYVDGLLTPMEPANPGHFGGWGPQQISAGGHVDENTVYRDPFLGDIDEIRVWSTRRTLEQIRDNMNRFLVGNEPGLVGYWRFDAGSGRVVADQTINANNLAFSEKTPDAMPEWVASSAPVSNEAPVVENAIDGLRTEYVAKIVEGPAVFEYPDTEVDAYDNTFSVMKRAYAYVDETGTTQLLVGYKVGDLLRVYIGQIQTKPQLIGYVEGAPPIPSENLTKPYYLDPIGFYFQYEGISSLTVTEKTGESVSLSSSRKDSRGVEGKLKAGLSGETKVFGGVQVPMGPVIMYQEVHSDWEASVSTNIEWKNAASQGAGVGATSEREHAIHVKSAGAWEEPGDTLTGERRWLMSNRGVAVVKSATADLYGLFVPSTGALAGLSVVPNKDIPVDTNLIYFPIDSSYVQNGSLDGRVGFQADPACMGQPSYYRPVEAYSLARTIDRETAQLDAWYKQFDPSQRALSFRSDLSDAVTSSPFYDWANRVPTKSIMNKYVWAAGAGLYREQEGYSSKRQESYGGDSDFSFKLGPAAGLMFHIGPVGLHFELEVMGGMGWTVTVDKDKDEDAAIDMDVDIDPEGFLGTYDAENKTYSETPVPGKVDTYRFNTYYLAPAKQNTNDFATVVDQNWLVFSNSPQAAEVREMIANSAGKSSWRVLHRVTFVSRIPPSFQTVPVASQAPPIAQPARLEDNELLITLTRLRIGGEKVTPALISSAVRAVYYEDLSALIPWWSDFLAGASVTNSDDAATLQQIILDSIQYMTSYYAAAGEQAAIVSATRALALS